MQGTRQGLKSGCHLCLLGNINENVLQVQGLQCQAIACSAIVVSWQAPQQMGQPPMHKYKLERIQTLNAAQDASTIVQWATAAELPDEDEAYQDQNLKVCLPCNQVLKNSCVP